jgi:hypothetical protein
MKLSAEQLATLRAIPAEAAPNRLRVAFALTDSKQSDACEALGWTAPQMSSLVRGEYKSVSIDRGHQLALYFGCAIEDLFPSRERTAVAS